MTQEECQALADKAGALGLDVEARRIIGGTWRLYVTRPDGLWTFCVSPEDLEDVLADPSLWCPPGQGKR